MSQSVRAILVCSTGLVAGCLTGERPNLDKTDLVQPGGLAGSYEATLHAGPQQGPTMPLRIVGQDDGSYLAYLTENGKEDPPELMRILDLKPDTQVVVLENPNSPDQIAEFGILARGSNGNWQVSILDIAETSRNDTLKPIVQRHGAEVEFHHGLGNATDDRLKGTLTADELRTLYSDPDFLAATKNLMTIELAPKP